MTSFYYYDQNPSGFFFLVQIRAFLAEITKFKYERKAKRILVVACNSQVTPSWKWPIEPIDVQGPCQIFAPNFRLISACVQLPDSIKESG